MSSYKILLTGATGYVGGSVLSQILESVKDVPSKHPVSVLIRRREKAALFEKMGLNPIFFESLDESGLLRQVASEHDTILHLVTTPHLPRLWSLDLGIERSRLAKRFITFTRLELLTSVINPSLANTLKTMSSRIEKMSSPTSSPAKTNRYIHNGQLTLLRSKQVSVWVFKHIFSCLLPFME